MMQGVPQGIRKFAFVSKPAESQGEVKHIRGYPCKILCRFIDQIQVDSCGGIS